VYASLDGDLTSPPAPRRRQIYAAGSIESGRHPLPSVEQAALVFGRLGVGRGIQVVAYDAAGGTIAARLWWMLRWLGHTSCAVLDGGWQRWLAEDRPLASGSRPPQRIRPIVHPGWLLPPTVDGMRLNTANRVLDARAYERYLGKNETIDPVAGHIPGALSAPNQDNSAGPDFKSQTELRNTEISWDVPAERSGLLWSGVTATTISSVLRRIR
jgi:thiosulfate/3-mercaptopyruvate sulfurtransferase